MTRIANIDGCFSSSPQPKYIGTALQGSAPCLGGIVFRALIVGVASLAAVAYFSAPATAQPLLGNSGLKSSPSCYIAASGDCVESPDSNTNNVTAVCSDGSDSHSESRSGTCSRHGGVSQWCPCGGAAQSNPVVPSSDGDTAQNVATSSADKSELEAYLYRL